MRKIIVLFMLFLLCTTVFGASRIQIRRDTAANWAAANPILAQGEMGFETNAGKLKFGDGVTAWSLLSYFAEAGGGGSYTGVSPIVVANDTNQISLNVLSTSDWNGLFDGQEGSYYLSYSNLTNKPSLASLVLPWVDANVADNITVNWTGLDTYPTACSAGEFVSAVGDTLTCSVPAGGTETYLSLPWADANVADNITLTNITQVTNRAFSDISGRNFSLLAQDNNTGFDARYSLLSDANDASRLVYTVIANPPWLTSYIDTAYPNVIPWADVNVADNITLTNFSQVTNRPFSLLTLDNNNQFDARYCLLTDTNNASRTIAATIADLNTVINAGWLSYSGAIKDTNTGIYDIRAEDLNSIRLGVKTVAYVQGRTYTAGLTSSVDLNITNGTSTGIGFSADSNKIWSGGRIIFDNNGTDGCLNGC